MAEPADLHTGVTAVVREVFDDPGAQVENLYQLSGGASRETWSLQGVLADGTTHQLIVRRDPPTVIRPEGMTNEAAAFIAAARAGVPEPRLLFHSDDPAILGSPFILMEHVDGETIARRILRDDRYAAVRPTLAGQCGEILARIHSIPTAEVPGGEQWDSLERTRQTFDELVELFGDPHPAIELGFRRLAAERPDPGPVTVCRARCARWSWPRWAGECASRSTTSCCCSHGRPDRDLDRPLRLVGRGLEGLVHLIEREEVPDDVPNLPNLAGQQRHGDVEVGAHSGAGVAVRPDHGELFGREVEPRQGDVAFEHTEHPDRPTRPGQLHRLADRVGVAADRLQHDVGPLRPARAGRFLAAPEDSVGTEIGGRIALVGMAGGDRNLGRARSPRRQDPHQPDG